MPALPSHRIPAVLAAVACIASSAPAAAAAATHSPTPSHHKAKHRRHHTVRTVHVRVTLGSKAGGRGGDPGDDYPAKWKNAPQDSTFDNWREYNRECTSFAAWALASRNGFNMPFYDNAKKWGDRARALGYRVDGSPAAGSIAWSNAGTYGHVAYVVDVQGGSVSIEEYNHAGTGRYSARTVPAANFTGYIHFADVTPPASMPAPALSVAPVQGGTMLQNATAVPIQGGGTTAIQGGSTTPVQGGSSTPIQGSATPVQGQSGGSGQPTPSPTQPATPPTFTEQQGHLGVNTFTNPYNASGMGARIGAGQSVQVSCRVYAPQIASANPDGWWYRIHSSPWNDAYYSPANTFMNGDPWNGPYSHNTDFGVPAC